ncbi:MAG: 4Fe-4S dicluster domain-containing protein, partial [Bacteroidales bacterium]|nr:4Fe-4S dicluster domain-containing protein [Bacteroidales bacterium]
MYSGVIGISLLYGNRERALRREAFQVTEAGRKRADECIKCGMCESVCPQHIEIRKYLE